MKILAIRGKNLASLAGVFEVDFLQEPLASAGLFAITGATGAGKSTLLDALCLALYEQTPRLNLAGASRGESVPDVGEHGLSPNDPRSLLRRGASDGYAEVDFVGNDHRAYRARWSVRRARNRANGKLQATEMQFHALPGGEPLGDHRKTETLKQIEAAIGLNFAQFTRSVLLAQNDFASFLRAPDDERATLLQTLTGTQEFSELSRLAYQRMKEERERAEQLQHQWEGLQCLSTEQVQALVQARQDTERQCAELATAQHRLDLQLHWLKRREEFEQAVETARHELSTAEQAWRDALPRRQQWQRQETAQSGRALLAWLEQVEQETTQLTQALADAANQRDQLARDREHAARTRTEAEARLAASERAQQERHPDLERALVLDRDIERLGQLINETRQQQQAARARLDEADGKRSAHEARRTNALAAEKALRARLVPLDRWAATFADWTHWRERLRQIKDWTEQDRLARKEASSHATEIEELGQQVETLTRKQAQQQQVLQQAQVQRAACRTALLSHHPDSLRTDLQRWRQRRDTLQAAQYQCEQVQALRARFVQGKQRLNEQQERLTALDTALAAHREQHIRLEAAAHTAEHAYELARLAATPQAEDFRRQLQPGHPCPVCGASDHPHAHQWQGEQVLAPLKAHRDREQAAWRAGQQNATRTQAQRESLETQRQQQASELQSLTREILEHDTALQNTLRQLNLDVTIEEAAASLSRAEEDAERERRALEARQTAQEAAQQADQEAESAVETARQQADALDKQIQILRDRLQARNQQRQRHLDQAEGWLRQRDEALLDCAPAFAADADWPSRFLASPATYLEERDALARQWQQDREAAEAHRQQAHAQEVHLQALQQQRPDLLQQCQEIEQRLSPLEQSLARDQIERRTLLGGHSVEQVRHALHTEQATAQQQARHAVEAHQQHEQAYARLLATIESLDGQLKVKHADRERSHQALTAWLAAQQSPDDETFHWDRTALAELLQRSSTDHQAEGAALDVLRDAMQHARAALQTQQRNLSQHLSTSGPEQDRDTLLGLHAETQAALDAANANLLELRTQLATDQRQQQQANALQQRIQDQAEQSRVWNQLAELIGSADGKKFRNFAQQLTLDILLSHANQHLDHLSRRYRLLRNPNSLGLMVIDQEMGEEQRSVHSLSGGESFLLSLSLALGLASLSSHRVRVDTLFIDEGFGSLDADALNLAMDALDRLQSSGRKVGVITHVQEMTERISTQIQVRRLAGGQSQLKVIFR